MVPSLPSRRTSPGGKTGNNIPNALFQQMPRGGLRTPDYASPTEAEKGSLYASLALHVPEAAARMDEEEVGILHLEVGAMRLATRDAISRRDWQTVARHFDFAAELLETGGVEVRDAFYVSYLGNLFYDESTLNFTKARRLLPRPLALALAALEHHYDAVMRAPA